MRFLIISFALLSLLNTNLAYAQDTAKAKSPVKPALLVIDIQKAYLDMIPDQEKARALKYINAAIELFREYNYPVIRVYHYGKEYGVEPGSKEFEYPEKVKLKNDDPKIIKTYSDGFNKTDLDKIIREHGSNTLFLCGLSAIRCVLATWFGAQNHDYKAFLVKNAIMSHNSEYTKNIEEIYDATSINVIQLILENCKK